MDNFEIIKKNLSFCEKKKKELDDIRTGTAREAADILNVGGVPTAEDIRELFSGRDVDAFTFASVCSFVNKEGKTVLQPPKSVTYVRNPSSDKAFLAFSDRFGGLSASYSGDFASCCEDVYYDRADACILPLEDSDVGLIASFRSLMMKYELKIASVCRIYTDEGAVTLSLLTSEYTDYSGDTVEIFFPDFDPSRLGDLSGICGFFGAEVIRINSTPSEYTEGYGHHFTFDTSESDADSLIYTLEALFPSAELTGRYNVICTE